MAKTIKVLVNTGNEQTNKTFDVTQGSGKAGKPTAVKAIKGARYQLEDPAAKNVGPENIRTKRVGKNLHVMLDGSSEADLIIEGYYDEDMLTETNRGLYGRAEDGKLYEYIPEDPTPAGLPINLADGGKSTSQVLGGGQVGEDFALSGVILAAAGGGFGALTAGAAAVGAAALAGGGGGGGGTATTPDAAAALTAIKDAAQANNATDANVAASVFANAGVTGVDATNVAAIQSALNSAAVNGLAADTKEEVQAIVDAYNAIKTNADGTANNNATNPTQAQYTAIGVTGVDTATEESLLGDAIDAKPFSAVDTVPEVQTMADAAAAVMTGAAGGTAPTLAQLEALGITGVTTANLAAVQAAIANTADNGTGVDTLSELQAVANAGATNAANAAAALNLIKAAAENNTATSSNLAADVFVTAGVTGVTADNLAAIQSALDDGDVQGNQADTLAEVQAIVDAYNAIKSNADATANNNATNPTAAQYTVIGVTGVNSDVKTSLLGDVVDAKAFTDVDTVGEVQALADAAAAVMTAAAGPTGGNAPTRAQLEALGITGVTDANLQYVQDSIARTADDGIGVDTLAELQAVVTIGIDAAAAAAAATAAIAAISAAAQANDASNTNVAASVFVTAGVTGVDSTNVAAIQSALNSANVNGAATDTLVEIQNIVNAYNAIRENADGTANNYASNPTQAEYALIGVTGVDTAAEESLLGDAIDAKPFSAVDSVPEVQALADAAAAVIAGASGGTAPTQAQLNALGITGVTPANLAAVQAAIAANGSGAAGVDTLTELQTVVTNAANAAAALDTIKAAAEGDTAASSNLAASVFSTAGVTGVTPDNLTAIQSALDSAAVNGAAADTKPEVQAIVDAYNAIKTNADGTANNNATNPTAAQYTAIGVTGVNSAEKESLLGDVVDAKPFTAVDTVAEVQALADAAAAVITGATGGTAPTQTQLEALGITGVTSANLAAVVAAIAATGNGGTGVDTLGELQTVVTNAANAAAAAAALSAIAAAAQANDATNTNVATTVFATAGVTGVDANNVAAIQSALNSAAVLGTSADTLGEVQAIVDAYNAIKANADTASTANATDAQYAAIGVTGVDSAVKTSLLGDAIDGKAFADVDTVAEVQALADAAAAVMSGAAGSTAPTQAQLAALGITGVTPANLAAVQAAIAATTDNGTGVDTLTELQTVVTNAVNAAAATTAALDTIKAAAEANSATSGNLAASVFATAGVTGVDGTNLSAIQSALDSTAVNGVAADTTAEVQAIVDAYKVIKDNADTAGTTNATAAQYTAVGVTGIDNTAKTSLLGDVVDTKAFADVDTVLELQTLATAAAAVITGAAAGTQPTKAQLEALGITGVTDANLSAIQAAIAATPDDGTGVDTLSELQAVANTGATNAANAAAIAAALSTIAAAAQADNASNTNVPYTLFATAGVTGVDANNVAAIQSALNDTDVQSGQADTAAKVQAVVDAYNAIKANADTASTANATQAQYAAIGINGIDSAAKTSLLGDVVDTKAFADVDTVAKVQALADLAALVINSAGTGTAPTKAQLESLGITGVTDANLSAIQAAIAATADDGTGVDTLSELQAVANTGATNAANAAAAAAALSTIAAAAQANDATNTNVPASVFATAGVTGVDANNIAAIQSALNDADVQSGQADTAAKVQAVVDAYNAIKANADTAGTNNATQAQYAAIGINGIDSAAKTSLLGDVVDTKAFADVDTVDELQALATAAAAVISGATAGGTAPTKAQLEALGITGVTTGNLAAVLAAIAATPDDGTGVDTLIKLQTLVSSINDAPTGANAAFTVLEDGSKTFAAADFGFADTSDSPANTLSAVIITTLPTAGTLKLNGTDVTLNQSIAAADLGNLVFAPAANANGAAYTTLGFKVQDNGGTANGGADTSTTANTLTFNVTAVNDQPTAPTSTTATSTEDQGAPTSASFGQTIGSLASLSGSDVEGATVGLAFVAPITLANTYGKAWYSIDGGTTWLDLTAKLATASATNALILDASARVYFQGNANQSGGLGSATFRTWDGTDSATSGAYKDISTLQGSAGAYSATTGSLNFGVSAVNDAPVNTVPVAQSTTTATAKVITGLQIADVDAYTADMTITLAVDHGTISVATGTGVTLGTNGTSSVTLTGTKDSLNALLVSTNAVTYTSAAGYVGSDTLTMTTSDNGNTGSGSTLTDQDTVAITVASPDSIAPTLIASNPGDNGNIAAIGSNLTLTFSEAVKAGTGLIQLYNASNTLVESFDVASSTKVTGWNTSTLTINPSVDLTAATGYYVKVAASAVKDLANNAYAGITDATTLNFTTPNADGSVSAGTGYRFGETLTQLGNAASSAGDFNGDGYADMIIGSHYDGYTGGQAPGAAYIVYGNASGAGVSSTTDSIDPSLGIKISGNSNQIRLGNGVAGIGDVNGDGLDDVLVSGENNQWYSGEAYVIYGTKTGVSFNVANLVDSQGFKITATGGNVGYNAWSVGDINGDGIADMALSNYWQNATNGSTTYVIYGSSQTGALSMGASSIDQSRGFVIKSDYTDLMSVSGAGDVNGDGLADLIIGEKGYNGTQGGADVFVVYGTQGNTTTTLDVRGGTIASSLGFKISSALTTTEMGGNVASAGDMNGDGLADIAVTNKNSVFVVYGTTSAPSTTLSLDTDSIDPSQGFKIKGPTTAGRLGGADAQISNIGDMNGDGLSDILVANTGYYSGAYVVYGNTTGALVDLSEDTIASSQGFKINGNISSYFGAAATTAGDINGDGLNDLIVGDSINSGQKGAYYIILGGTQNVTNAVTLTGTSSSEAVMGTSGNDVLTGNGGVDRFFAGKGNDTVVLNSTDVSNLANNVVASTKAFVSGGTGFDTAQLTGGANLDLTTISNVGAVGLTLDSRVESIERVDMRTDTAANTLTIAAKDVADMADFNSIHTTTASDDGKTWTNVNGGTALSATTKFHQVVVDGTSADIVNLAVGNGYWTNVGEVNNGTTGYFVYQNTAMNSQVIVDKTVVVNNNDPFVAPPLSASLDLGTVSGVRLNLIKKVEAPNGKIYYFVDLDGNGTPTGNDYTDHNALDTLFNGGVDTTGLSNPIAGQDTERSVIVNGYTLVLPTVAEFTASLTTGNTDWDVIYGWGPTILNFMTADPNGAGNHWAINNSGFGIETSSETDTWINGFVVEVKVPVAPVVLDLNRDGTFSYSQVAMDVNGTNHLSLTQWAGAQDGVLVWDKLGDGVVHDNSQYAFGQYATSTRVDAAGYNRVASDLDGLSDAFDTNHDGKFNAADAQFAQFSVWQDANQNGVSDAGEVRSLADWGITEINLVSDGVQRTPVAGVTEVGQSTATLADGSSMQVADALFAYNALDYSVTGNAMNLLGADMHLDLSSIVAVHSNVTAMDLTGTGANTVKLSLADVLSVATDASIANGMHTLTLTGDANDTVELDLSQWANSGNTVTEGDHTYAVYNASSAAAAQLLIDQHMVLATHG